MHQFKSYLTDSTPFKLTPELRKELEDIASSLPDDKFKKEYGDEWKSVKMGTAMNMLKKKHGYSESVEYLEEKLLMINNGAQYGQIVFLAGGAGSGKGFAIDNFMEGQKFKVIDVDEWKKKFLKLANVTNKYKELKGLKLSKPADVEKLHDFVKKMKIKDKVLNNMILQMKNKETLPNIMFDMTFNDIKKAKKLMPDLLKAGYNPANIHLVWILQEYRIALKQNKDPERDRVVPKNIMFHTHEGAGKTIYELLAKKSKPIALNGSISVILNNPKNTIYFEPTGNESNPKKKVIKDFKYLTLKKRGQRMFRDQIVMKELFFWIKASIPKGEFSKFMQAKVDNPELDESFKQFHKEEQALRFIDLLPKKVKHAIRRIAHKDKYKAALHMYHGLKKDPDAKKRLTDKKMKEIAADHFKLKHKEFEAILNRKTRYQ
ncbi:MAG: hypothetical protein CMD98_06810 [Gammaproteobacteria bacterium]|nr:hypothetical protein [Gammaproteobacteria bacterium]|tara:strand:+ start:33649 stop:34944 length:1296 start_codon:yes stop_codon:yes gene_type:complete